jgi:hypothetical protein
MNSRGIEPPTISSSNSKARRFARREVAADLGVLTRAAGLLLVQVHEVRRRVMVSR